MIKCEIKKDSITLDVSGNLEQITCDILMLVSALYEKMEKSDTPLLASLFKDGLKKAFREDVPFNVKDEPRNVMTDVEESADELIDFLDGFMDYLKKRSKKDDKRTKD